MAKKQTAVKNKESALFCYNQEHKDEDNGLDNFVDGNHVQIFLHFNPFLWFHDEDIVKMSNI